MIINTLVETISTILLLALVSILWWRARGTQSSPPSVSLTIGAALGVAFFMQIFSLNLVIPTNLGWLMQGDWEWHFMGWHSFRSEPWHFPPGKLSNFWFPVGTAIGYTDSIPLLALLLKPWSALLPSDFQYFGFWLLSCFVLQGVFAALLLRLLTPHLLLQTLGVLFFLIHPILLFRFSHLALCAHWLLLAGLWLYFKPWPNRTALAPFKPWWLLISLAATIHPYLTAMVIALALAFYGRWWFLERRCTFVMAGLQLSGFGLTVLFLWWMIGYFVIDSQVDWLDKSFGFYSMNLLSPFFPQLGWSRWLQELSTATAGQYEGFNYLGVGVLLLGVWALYELMQRPPTKNTLKSLLPLGLISLGLTLFAVSHKVTWGATVLWELDSQFVGLLSVFRSSGRFFWPVNYALLFLLLSLFIRRHSFKLACFYLTIGLVIQEIDFYPKHQVYAHSWHGPTASIIWNNPLKSAIWEFAAPHYQHLVFIPPVACGEEAAPFGAFSYLAGKYGLTINTGRLSRAEAEKTMQYCRQLFEQVQAGKVKDDAIYLVHANYLENFKTQAKVPLRCAKIDGINTCVTEQSYLPWYNDYLAWQKSLAN